MTALSASIQAHCPGQSRIDVPLPAGLVTGGRIARSVRLLRGTRARLSLFIVRFSAGQTAGSAETLASIFEGDAIVESIQPGLVGVLVIRFDGDDGTVADQGLGRVMAALDEMGCGEATVHIAHQSADVVCDPDDLWTSGMTQFRLVGQLADIHLAS